MSSFMRCMFCFCPRETRSVHPLPNAEENAASGRTLIADQPKADEKILAPQENQAPQVETEAVKPEEPKKEEIIGVAELVDGIVNNVEEKDEVQIGEQPAVETSMAELVEHPVENKKEDDLVEETLQKAAEIMKELTIDEDQGKQAEEIAVDLLGRKNADSVSMIVLRGDSTEPIETKVIEEQEDHPIEEKKEKPSPEEKNDEQKIIKVKATVVRELPKKSPNLKNMDYPRMKKDTQVKFKELAKPNNPKKEAAKKKDKKNETSEESKGPSVDIAVSKVDEIFPSDVKETGKDTVDEEEQIAGSQAEKEAAPITSH